MKGCQSIAIQGTQEKNYKLKFETRKVLRAFY